MKREIQQYLDVDLAIRGVDAAGIIHEIGVDSSSVLSEFDSCRLRQAKVSTLADDFALQLVGIDPYRVIAAIVCIEVGFRRRFHVSADPSVPQQIYAHSQNQLNDFRWRCEFLFGPQHRADFGGELDPFDPPFEYTSTG